MPKVPMTPEQLLRWHNAQAQLHALLAKYRTQAFARKAARP